MGVFLLTQTGPDQPERGRKPIGVELDPQGYLLPGGPRSALDFSGVQDKGTVVLDAVDPNELPTCLGLRLDIQPPLRRTGGGQSDLFLQLSAGGSVIRFSCIYVSGARRIPKSWRTIFGHGSFLKKDTPIVPKHKHVHRTMRQLSQMHLASCGLRHDFVVRIHHVKQFIEVLR